MATLGRNPLVQRTIPPQSPSGHHGMKTTRTGTAISKRPRSPDPVHDSCGKRPKGVPASPAPSHLQPQVAIKEEGRPLEKDEKRALRDAAREDFRVKYRKAFPSWSFYFDADLMDNPVAEALQADVESLGAVRSNSPLYIICNSQRSFSPAC